jgi:hypothetical protein
MLRTPGCAGRCLRQQQFAAFVGFGRSDALVPLRLRRLAWRIGIQAGPREGFDHLRVTTPQMVHHPPPPARRPGLLDRLGPAHLAHPRAVLEHGPVASASRHRPGMKELAQRHTLARRWPHDAVARRACRVWLPSGQVLQMQAAGQDAGYWARCRIARVCEAASPPPLVHLRDARVRILYGARAQGGQGTC